ncbi:MAG: bacillithiol biosynthesis deacetylase BshB1 [Gemmatimonadaceae bacterium]|nr:bacillithiol biosynthesis deacetylase BshB1 [Gemmatimonadaceae bacterium]
MTAPPMTDPLDVLAIMAHPDDVELTCGGTLLAAAAHGRRTGVVDLTAGETGSRGTVGIRAAEAQRAAAILGVTVRENLYLPDAHLVNSIEAREVVIRAIRRLRPTIVITHARQGRHPDHIAAAQLVRDACFLAGLKNLVQELPPFRPRKVVHAMSFREDAIAPSFVVDISEVFEKKLEAIACYASQFDGLTQAGEVYPNGEPLPDIIRHQAAHYGTLIRARYGEPFHTTETLRVSDIASLDVSTF